MESRAARRDLKIGANGQPTGNPAWGKRPLTLRFLHCDRVRSMRRGGIHAARKTMRSFGVAGAAWRLLCLVGREFTPAEHHKKFLKNYRCGGVKTPALQGGGNGQPTATPARRTPLPGGIYASPTNKGTAYKNRKRCRGVKGPLPLQVGMPVFCSPRRGRGTGIFHFSFGQRRRRQPLTAPAMKPCSKYFCTKG